MSSRINNVDARLNKEFVIREKWRLQGIIQAFNIFNHTNFGLPYSYLNGRVTNALSDNFGEITTARPARQLELALQFKF